jgi:hypothetical protein
MMRIARVTISLILGFFVPAASALQTETGSVNPELEQILNQMTIHDTWQARHLIQYEVKRTFYAANPRFNLESVLEVTTHFRRPNSFESEIVRSEGSSMIRERVFDRILDAEKEANSTKEMKEEVSITPEHYNFSFVKKEICDGRSCYQMRISPKEKSKYSIVGDIWVDAADGAMIRIQGRPAKKPSMWTLNTEIERHYSRIAGVWLCDAMESHSNIFIGGPSTLKVEYKYVAVQTETTAAQ